MSIDRDRKKNIENNVVKRFLWLFLISPRLEGLKKNSVRTTKKLPGTRKTFLWHRIHIYVYSADTQKNLLETFSEVMYDFPS